jgi:hypothetical protein
MLDRVRAIQCELAVTPIYEMVPSMTTVLSWLMERGFEPTGFFPVSRKKDHLRVVELDCVLLRR